MRFGSGGESGMACTVQRVLTICRNFLKQEETTREEGHVDLRGLLRVLPVIGGMEVRDECLRVHSSVRLGHWDWTNVSTASG